jgi:hypothetical protein
MQYLYLHRINDSSLQAIRYVYRFDDHALSPGNLVIRNLFYAMLEAVKARLDRVEVEYSDIEMVKRMGMEPAVAFLKKMGADQVKQEERRKDGVLLSRVFTAPLTPERLDYFFGMRELDDVYRLRFLAQGEEKVHLYFAETLSAQVQPDEEEVFLQKLLENHVPHKILQQNR